MLKEPFRRFEGDQLNRLRKKSFWTLEEGKLKLTPHGLSTTYGPSQGKLQLAKGLFPQPVQLALHGPSTTYGPSWGKLQLVNGLFPQPVRRQSVALQP